MLKVIKNTRSMCQIYSKLTIKTPEWCFVLLLLTLNTFCTKFYWYYCWTRTNVDWAWKTTVSDKKFVFSNHAWTNCMTNVNQACPGMQNLWEKRKKNITSTSFSRIGQAIKKVQWIPSTIMNTIVYEYFNVYISDDIKIALYTHGLGNI